METYTLLRQFADSWFLIAMVVFFLGTWVFAFWPSLKTDRETAAQIPLRDDPVGCAGNCAECRLAKETQKGPDHG